MSDKGYVYQYRKGQAHSVTHYVPDVQKLGITKISKKAPKVGQGYTIVHNHPSGSHFSTTDLNSWNSVPSQKRVVAVARGSRIAYTVTKTAKFNSKGFQKALNKIQLKTNSMENYNKSMESFLKSNAKKYGYTYSAKKV